MKQRGNILIGGKAGQGIDALAYLVAASLVKAGYYVFNYRDYQSLIKGGHNFNIICFAEEKIGSFDEEIDILAAFDENSYKEHKNKLKKGGVVLTSDKKVKGVFLEVSKFGRAENMAFLGGIGKILGLDKKILIKEMEKKFRKKDNKLNEEAVEHFYDQDYSVSFAWGEKEGEGGKKRERGEKKDNKGREEKRRREGNEEKGELLSGSEAIVKGGEEAGLEVYFGYPMTPATAVLALLAQRQDKDIFVFTPENEIAAANAALGASFAGRRAMTGTSGGGFDLMSEALSMQGMMELPLVVHLAQRSGPSTGIPTYTGQGDLRAAVYGGHGEFSRVVAAPGDAEEAYRVTKEVFFLAEKLGLLGIILTDKHLVESHYTSQLKKISLKMPLREKFAGKGIFKVNSYEHDLRGKTTEEAEEVKKAVERRKKKEEGLEKEAKKLSRYKIYGKGRKLLVGFGSTKGAILDALEGLKGFAYLHLIYLAPFPREIVKELEKAEEVYVIENNATGPLAELIREKTGFEVVKERRILKYDGRPLTPEEVKKRLKIS